MPARRGKHLLPNYFTGQCIFSYIKFHFTRCQSLLAAPNTPIAMGTLGGNWEHPPAASRAVSPVNLGSPHRPSPIWFPDTSTTSFTLGSGGTAAPRHSLADLPFPSDESREGRRRGRQPQPDSVRPGGSSDQKQTRRLVCGAAIGPALLGNKATFSCQALGRPSRAQILWRPREAGRVTGPGRAGDKRICNLLIYILWSRCSQRGFRGARV